MTNEPLPEPRPAPATPAGGASPASRAGDAEPALVVVRGQPTADEVAAVVVVLSARASAGATAPAGRTRPATASRSLWADRTRLLREVPAPGPGAWRRSFLPR